MGNQVLYVGSHVGDAQIVNVYGSPQTAVDEDTLPIPAGIPTHSARDINDDEDVDMDEEPMDKREGRGKIISSKGSYLEVLESHSNLAPIIDAALADLDESGQVPLCGFRPAYGLADSLCSARSSLVLERRILAPST